MRTKEPVVELRASQGDGQDTFQRPPQPARRKAELMSLGGAPRAPAWELGWQKPWVGSLSPAASAELARRLPSSPPNGALGLRRVAAKLTTGEVVRAGT